MKRLLFVVMSCTFFLTITSGFSESSDEYSETTTKIGITLRWKVVETNLDVIVSAPTTGWIAVGFDPTNKMKDANVIIGYVKDDEVFLRDDYAHTPTGHKADDKQGGEDNILLKEGKESEGVTEINFVIPLDSKDKYDRTLVSGKKYKVILAYGTRDSFTVYHTRNRTTVEITL